MKIGSIVECVSNERIVRATPLKIKGIYTVRELFKDAFSNDINVRLEEVINVLRPETNREVGYFIENFREIEFPPSMEVDIQEALVKETPKELIQTL